MTTADVATRRRRLGSLLYEVLVILALAIFLFLLPLAVFSGVSHLMPGRGLLWLYLFVLLGIYFVWCWVKAGQTLAIWRSFQRAGSLQNLDPLNPKFSSEAALTLMCSRASQSLA